MLFVDTNIFLEILLGQEKSNESELFLKWAHQENLELVCSTFSIHAIEAIISNRKQLRILKNFLEDLVESKNISIHSTSIEEEKQIIMIAEQTHLDFDDALQYFVAKKAGCKIIVSFDAHFDKTDMERKTPNEI